MMVALLNEPALVFDHIRRYTSSLSAQFVYGFRASTIDDPKLLVMYDNVDKFSEVTGAGPAALLDAFPILRVLPAMVRPFYKHAISLQEEALTLASSLWKDAKREAQEGKAKASYGSVCHLSLQVADCA
jgi:hypothetical protein